MKTFTLRLQSSAIVIMLLLRSNEHLRDCVTVSSDGELQFDEDQGHLTV